MKDRNICKFTQSGVADGLRIGCFVLESDGERIRTPHDFPAHRAILFLEGEGTVLIDGKVLPFRTGTLCFTFKGERFSAHSDGKCEYMYISFEGGRGEELLRRFGIGRERRTAEALDGVIPFWRESLLRACDATLDLLAESVLLYTLSRLETATSAQDELTARVTALSEEHFRDPSLSLATLAEELGYNAKYLSHAFKEKTGTSYTEYLRMLRLKHAVSLFELGLDSVKNVALLSGFSDPLYFSTVFKQSLGLSPREYIERTEKKRADT